MSWTGREKKQKKKIMSYFSPKFNFSFLSLVFYSSVFLFFFFVLYFHCLDMSQCEYYTWDRLGICCTSDNILFWVIKQCLMVPTFLTGLASTVSRRGFFWGKDRPGKMRVLLDSHSRLGAPERIWGGVPLSTRKGQVPLLSLTLWQNSQALFVKEPSN